MLRDIGGLSGTKNMSLQEIVAMFLYTLAHHKKDSNITAVLGQKPQQYYLSGPPFFTIISNIAAVWSLKPQQYYLILLRFKTAAILLIPIAAPLIAARPIPQQ